MSETRPFKKLARKYRFKYRATENQFVFVANNTDGEPTDWITLDKTNLMFHHTWHLSTAGNTDQNNLWFYQTRKDLTPKKIVSFIKSLSLLLNYNLKVYMLIDPEDWQEIAKINDAYDDVRYTMGEDMDNRINMFSCMTQAKHPCGVDKCECVEVNGVSDEEDFPINYKGSPADYNVWCQICNQGFNDACHPDLDCSCDICPDCYLEANKECPDCNNHRELYGCTDKEVTA